MNFNPFKLKTNSWFLISAIILMVAFYLFYFEYYVKNNEEHIITAHFRALDQMGVNIDKKLNVYINNANDLAKKVNYEWLNINDSLLIGAKQQLVNILNRKGDFNRDIRVIDFIRGVDENSYLQTLNIRNLNQNYYFTVKLSNPPFYMEKSNNGVLMVLETRYDRLIKDLQRDDVFDGLIVVRDTNIIFSTIGQQLRFMPVSENSNHESESSLSAVPALHPGKIIGGDVFDLSISNIAYKAFVKPLKINNDTWSAIGLIKAKNFNAESRSIEPWIIITLSMLLIFIILGLPVIKLKVLSETEQLDTKNIIDYALFVMLGGIFTVMFLSFIVQNNTHRQNINNKLAHLSSTIDSTFRDEIDKAYLQLEYYDSTFHSMTFPRNLYNSGVISNILTKEQPYYPKYYPYGDYYFWTNPKGIQTNYLTPIRTYGKLSDLSSRDYVNKKDEWFYPGSTNKKFRIQSIVSITSGTVKAAISKKGSHPKRPVIAVSSKMYSIINTILPMNYSFCIIDKTGKVWFHSNQNMNLKENFVEECNGSKYLKAAMYANISKTIDVNYYNNQCRIHIKRLDNLPLYLITILNKKTEKSFQAEVITFTLLLIGILLSVMFIQMFVLLIIETQLKHTYSRNLLVKLTMPIKRLNGRYRYLTILNLILSLITIAFLFFYSDMVAVTSIISIIIILFAYSHWLLNNNKAKEYHKILFGAFNIILFLFVTATGLFFSPSGKMWQIFLYDGVVFLTIILAHSFIKKDTSNNNRYWINYTLLLVTFLFIMGLIPALKFYETGYNNESIIRARHKLLDLMNQREQRNSKILSFYNKVNVSDKRDSIIKQRENLGIYTCFDNNTRYRQQAEAVKQTLNAKNNRWDTLFCYIRPFYDKSIVENKYLTLNNPSNSNLIWYQKGNSLTLEYNSLTNQIDQNRISSLYISTNLRKMNFVTPFSSEINKRHVNFLLNMAFWGLILFVLFFFFRLLKFGLYRLFNHNVIQNYLYQSFGERLQQILRVSGNIFIVRQAQSDNTTDFFADFLSSPNRKRVDWVKRIDVKLTKGIVDDFKKQLHKDFNYEISPVILITGFENDFMNLSLLNEKLSMLKFLQQRNDITLIIFSQVSLDVIRESYQKLLSGLTESGGDSSNLLTGYSEVINELKYISNIFTVSYMPVCYSCYQTDDENYCKKEPKNTNSAVRIERELDACDYLKQLKPAVTEFRESYGGKFGESFTGKILVEEILIEKTLAMAEKFYEDIFNSCSSAEKYVLLDFAHDSVINPKNEKVIYNLLDKGLLVRTCDKINLMNKSFLRFLMSKLSMQKELEAELSRDSITGTWQGYRITLILIIVSLFAFITMANQEFIDNLNNLFVVVGGGVAVVTGIVGLLSHRRKVTKS